MAQDIYILSACDGQNSWSTMRLQGVTTDETMLHAMLAAKIQAGDMGYGGFMGGSAYQLFIQDFIIRAVDYDKLKYGYVQTCENAQIDNPQSYDGTPGIGDAYEELIHEKTIHTVMSLNLDTHSFIYSIVEIHSDNNYLCFHTPGFCDRDDLETTDEYREFVEDLGESEINVNVSTYCVGEGESEDATDQELAAVLEYSEEIDDEYGIDKILDDFFSFYYEAEQEY